MSKLQTIAVEPVVKAALREIGKMGMSYNDVLKELLNIDNETNRKGGNKQSD